MRNTFLKSNSEKEVIPVKILNWEQGPVATTSRGLTPTIRMEFECISSGNIFISSVLDYSGWNSRLDKIIDSTLGKDVVEYDLSDLIGKELEVEVEYRKVNQKLYTNIIDASPLVD